MGKKIKNIILRRVIDSIKKDLLYTPFINSHPSSIDIFPTFRCNLKCRHCIHATCSLSRKEIDTKLWKSVITDLKSWIGRYCLRICGGEPFMRDDLLEIIEHTSKKGLPVIISTNGTLVNKHKIQVLSHFDIDLISVSLDTIDADKFDYMRGVTGTCKLAVNCIKEVKKAGIPVQVQALITDVNLEGLTELVRFCWNEGLLLSFQGLWHNYTKNSLSPNTYFWPRNSAYAAEVVSNIINIKKSGKSSIVDSIGYLKGLREYYRDAPSFVSNPQNRCLAFRKNLRIMDDGDVTTCFYSPSLGNIMKEHNTQALWTSDEAEEIRRRMAACNRNCSFIRCYYYDSFIEKIVKMQTFLKALRK